ncbi:ATP-grasp fold amidoligase family protein [Clostridium perfringens]|uniref:ATP-grasp fold amidoligase family protein n=1 Tax=Clostridium perfringens TaxID=1502 RepID=UPI002247F12C|nr:ATP-grasp fold amidoligase family protein [Clostridium perfringens]MCX0383542.1 glycosyltransferase [Clostridium perfringens]
MLDGIKKKMPKLYSFYGHLSRRKLIRDINKRKKIDEKQYPQMLAKEYKLRIGHELDWNNLRTYTEKMQWEKIYNKNPLKSMLADKLLVREWVTEKIGAEYLIPLLGTWDSFDKIDFSKLPKKFVLKTNHGTGTNILVKNKEKMDNTDVKWKINDWLETDYGYKAALELHYSKINPVVLAEQYIETECGELQDYKFLCFDGIPYFCWVDIGRYNNHTRNVYDLNWNLQPWNQEEYNHYKEPIAKPDNFEEMIRLVKVLSSGFSHVRVDLYNVKGRIYFGEMTFTNGSGFDRILPTEYDLVLGDLWKID